jgi:uncharacterized protein (TIGR02145 family)
MISKIVIRCLFAIVLFVIASFRPANEVGEPPLFRTVAIGSLEWMAENLNVSHFRNGDAIFEANTYEKWEYANIHGLPAWCYYNNNPEYGKRYGKLYNGWAIRDSRGLGPEGWRVPSDNEWTALAEALGGADLAGEKIRSSKDWTCDASGENNGFSGLPGGYRTHEMPKYYGGPFYEVGDGGYWWTSSGYLVDNIWARNVSCNGAVLGKISFDRTAAMSVRLVKDN